MVFLKVQTKLSSHAKFRTKWTSWCNFLQGGGGAESAPPVLGTKFDPGTDRVKVKNGYLRPIMGISRALVLLNLMNSICK